MQRESDRFKVTFTIVLLNSIFYISNDGLQINNNDMLLKKKLSPSLRLLTIKKKK